MSIETLDLVRSRIRGIETLPSMPVILRTLLETLDQPVEQVSVERVVELVSYDKTIAAQCVRMANSALFGRAQVVESVRTAVVNLGMWRVRDLVFSRCLTQVFSSKHWIIDASVFWRHSLGCAIVSRKLAELIRYPDVEKAYLAGLLHDIGILVNSIVVPDEFQKAFEMAVRECVPLDEAEQSIMGFTHAESGRVLALENDGRHRGQY
jgi:HD-like signal output (HDOD) protein